MGEGQAMNWSGKAYWIITLLLVSSLLFSYPVNSLCIIALVLVWLIEGHFPAKLWQLRREPLFILSAVLFLFYLLGIFFSQDKTNARFFVEKNLSLLILPTVLLSKQRFTERQVTLIGKTFLAGILILMGLATILAIADFWSSRHMDVFFYHKLSSHVGISAIVASLFCIAGMAWIFYLPAFRGKWLIALLLSAWLLLLISKLFLFILCLMIGLHFARRLSRKTGTIAVVSGLVLILLLGLVPNPIQQRFRDMGKFRWSYLTAPVFNEGIYFDGLSLRLVYARFGLEIVREKKAYLLGVGTGDGEALLQQKIRAYHMYTGDGVKDKEGYLQFGYHNEFVQKFVQMGLIGLMVFVGLIVYSYIMAIRYRNRLLLNVLLIFTFSFFTDTLLEQQVGIVMFFTFACIAISDIRRQQEQATA